MSMVLIESFLKKRQEKVPLSKNQDQANYFSYLDVLFWK
jgi:hypothetical protein